MQKNNKSILIIDDQAFIRHILCTELTHQGYDMHQADNGKTGLDAALETTPDLILLDIMMPIMDGFETCKKIRENPLIKHIPIIFLSANNQKTAVIKAIQSGGNDFVVKSPDTEVLIRKIEKYLGS